MIQTDSARGSAEKQTSGNVLIVDDEADLMAELAEMLRDAGIASVSSSSAKEALVLIAKNSDITAVISDLKMPDMNGLQLLRSMRDQGYEQPVIIMSGHVDADERALAMALGALSYVRKPCDICMIPQLLRPFVFAEGTS